MHRGWVEDPETADADLPKQMRTDRQDTATRLAAYDSLDWRTPAEVLGTDPRTSDAKVRLLRHATLTLCKHEREEADGLLLTRQAQLARGEIPRHLACVRRWLPSKGVRVCTTLRQWDEGNGYTEAQWAKLCAEGLA